jgi:uncharacterized membrane protein YeaQ/YmgE (transglycosylase-associated protein family)
MGYGYDSNSRTAAKRGGRNSRKVCIKRKKGDVVGILSWLILGLIVGFIASRVMGAGGYGLIGDIVVGILGAFVGGWLSTQFLGLAVDGINVQSIAISLGGAIILIFVSRLLMPGRRLGHR